MDNLRKIAGGMPWWGWSIVAVILIAGIAGVGSEDGGGGSDDW